MTLSVRQLFPQVLHKTFFLSPVPQKQSSELPMNAPTASPCCFLAACTLPRLGSQVFASCSHGAPTRMSYQVCGSYVGELFTFLRTYLAFHYSVPSSLTIALLPGIPHSPSCLTGAESLKDQPNSARRRWKLNCLPAAIASFFRPCFLP